MNPTVAKHFQSRKQAGQLLAQELKKYAREEVVVYALPRGGVSVAAEVAKILHKPLDLLTARKIGHPEFPEFAIAAVGEEGDVIKNDEVSTVLNENEWQNLVQAAELEARRRHEIYLRGHSRPEVRGKVAIVIDDGLATGLTLEAAISDLKKKDPKKIVVAVPVAPALATSALQRTADEVIILFSDPHFMAISLYYDELEQLSDDEVVKILQDVNERYENHKRLF